MHLPPSNQPPPRPGTNNSIHSASGRKRKLDPFSHHPGSGSVQGGGGIHGSGSVNGSVSTMHSQQSGLHSAQPSTQFRNPNRHNLPQNSHHTLYAEYAQEIVPFKCLRVGEAPAHKAQTRKHTLKEYEEQRQEAELLSKTVRCVHLFTVFAHSGFIYILNLKIAFSGLCLCLIIFLFPTGPACIPMPRNTHKLNNINVMCLITWQFRRNTCWHRSGHLSGSSKPRCSHSIICLNPSICCYWKVCKCTLTC